MIFNLSERFRLIFPSFSSSYLDIGLTFLIILTLIITLVLAYRRLALSRRFFGVCVLNILACFALIGLISDLQQQTRTNQKAIILTYGTSQNQVNSLFDKTLTNENTKVFILSKEQQWQDSLDLTQLKNTLIIDNVAAIYSHQSSVTHLSVYGDGLLPQQWQTLESIHANSIDTKFNVEEATKLNIDFYPSEVRTGPIKLNWPKQLIVGQPFTLSGQFVSATKDKARIVKISLLDIYDELMDEMYVKNQEKFNLSARVKNTGRYIYQLKIYDDNQQLIVTEPIAFTVFSSEKLKVAIKQSSASFESKYLKNWLAEQGEEVLVITKISKDKYIQQHINANSGSNSSSNTFANANADKNLQNDKANITEKDYEKLSETWLSEFDLLYLDSRAFYTLDENELDQLDTAVKQGLGLLIIVNDYLNGSITASDNNKSANSLLRELVSKNILQQKYSTSTQVLNTVPRWLHSQNERAITYESIILPMLSILPMAKAKVIIQGNEGQALLVNNTYGLGNIAFSLVASSHQWSISGEKNTYSHYWQTIIEQVSRHNHSLAWLNSAENVIYFKGQTQTLCAQSAANKQSNVMANQINLVSTVTAESTHCGKYWPNNTGWQSLSLLDETTEEIQIKSSSQTQFNFVYSHENWLTWQQHIKQQVSLANANNRIQTISELRYVSINKVYFWWLFFFTLSLLWVERKVSLF